MGEANFYYFTCLNLIVEIKVFKSQNQDRRNMADTAASLDCVPNQLRNLRACLLCSLVKTFDQFEMDGCDNCDSFLQLKNNRESVYTCTSSSFEGVVAMMSPDDSWVAKWQRIGNLVKGCYAISVQGKLPTQVVQDLRSQGVMYRSRDTSTVA